MNHHFCHSHHLKGNSLCYHFPSHYVCDTHSILHSTVLCNRVCIIFYLNCLFCHFRTTFCCVVHHFAYLSSHICMFVLSHSDSCENAIFCHLPVETSIIRYLLQPRILRYRQTVYRRSVSHLFMFHAHLFLPPLPLLQALSPQAPQEPLPRPLHACDRSLPFPPWNQDFSHSFSLASFAIGICGSISADEIQEVL